MPRRLLVYFIAPAIGAGFGPRHAAFAQYCIGATSYVVRDETGAVMDSTHMQRLTLSINGVPQRWRMGAGKGEPPHYEHEAIRRSVRVVGGVKRVVDTTTIAQSVLATNPLVFGPFGSLTACDARELGCRAGVVSGRCRPADACRFQDAVRPGPVSARGDVLAESFRVDKRGDLTFIPALPNETASDACTAIFVVLYRSGIRSMAGTPLPAPVR